MHVDSPTTHKSRPEVHAYAARISDIFADNNVHSMAATASKFRLGMILHETDLQHGTALAI